MEILEKSWVMPMAASGLGVCAVVGVENTLKFVGTVALSGATAASVLVTAMFLSKIMDYNYTEGRPKKHTESGFHRDYSSYFAGMLTGSVILLTTVGAVAHEILLRNSGLNCPYKQ